MSQQGQSQPSSDPAVSHGEAAAPITEERVREELARVLSSHEFRSSKRSQEFLRYVVEHALSGRTEMLKERIIGIEVFGRPATYDPSDDASVRVKAGEVRKRLGLYYSDEGAHNPARIELPSGTYIPEFRVTRVAEPTEAALPANPPPLPTTRRFLTRSIIAVAALFAAGGIAALWFGGRPSNTPLDQFWAPVLNGSSPASLCAAFVPVYGVDDANVKPSRPDNFTLLTDQFVGGGDLIAVSRLASMLTRIRRPYRVRVGSQVSFADLRGGPAILVGYSYTHWKEISRQMRYFIDGARRPVGITDNGEATEWILPALPPDRHTDEDYAIVSRVFHPDTHEMLVELAGITQYGTDAASDLVTNPDLMAEALTGGPATPGGSRLQPAPADWQKKNLQLVLHVKVIAGAPSSPQVVGRYFW
jgi:hypothetical protein